MNMGSMRNPVSRMLDEGPEVCGSREVTRRAHLPPSGSHPGFQGARQVTQEAEAEDHRSPQNLPSRTGVWRCNCHLLWNRLDSDTSCLCRGLRAALSACHSSSSNPVHSWPCPRRAPGHQREGEAGISESSSILAP